jgi:hypothetical protein
MALLLLSIFISWLQDIYSFIYVCVCETVCLSRVYKFAAVLCLQWMVYVALFPATSILSLHITASRSICLGQNIIDFVLEVPDVALSKCVARICSHWFSDGLFCPSYYWYYFSFYIPPLYFYYKVFTFQSIFGLYIDHISLY